MNDERLVHSNPQQPAGAWRSRGSDRSGLAAIIYHWHSDRNATWIANWRAASWTAPPSNPNPPPPNLSSHLLGSPRECLLSAAHQDNYHENFWRRRPVSSRVSRLLTRSSPMKHGLFCTLLFYLKSIYILGWSVLYTHRPMTFSGFPYLITAVS